MLLALAGRPRALLLDEPTAGLAAVETAAVVTMIERFPRDITVLLIEHDMDVALALADRVTVLHQGRVLAEGTRDEVRRDARVAEIYLGVDQHRGGSGAVPGSAAPDPLRSPGWSLPVRRQAERRHPHYLRRVEKVGGKFPNTVFDVLPDVDQFWKPPKR